MEIFPASNLIGRCKDDVTKHDKKLTCRRFKVVENGAIQMTICNLLLVCHCKYSSILYHFWVIWR